MNVCLNCSHWMRTEDRIIGVCRKWELPGEAYRFQYESCQHYEQGETRCPYNEKGYAKRVRDYSDLVIEPELELRAVELLRQGVPVVEARKRLKIGAQVMSAIVRRHREEYEIGLAIRHEKRLDPLDEYADQFKKLLDAGASFYKVQMVTGINRQRVSAYVQRKGWKATEASNG